MNQGGGGGSGGRPGHSCLPATRPLQQIGRGAGRAYFFGCDSSPPPPGLCCPERSVCMYMYFGTHPSAAPSHVSSTSSPTGGNPRALNQPSQVRQWPRRQNARSPSSPATASLRWGQRVSCRTIKARAIPPIASSVTHSLGGIQWGTSFPSRQQSTAAPADVNLPSLHEGPPPPATPRLPGSQGRSPRSMTFLCLGFPPTAAWTSHWPRSLMPLCIDRYRPMKSVANMASIASRRRHGDPGGLG